MPTDQVLTFPDPASMALSIRAKALLFHDPQSVAVLEQVERIARSEATALIVGETGTGKELIARHIHKRSGRQGPFVAVNCGAFSETLFDAELFGHEIGSFTGATQARAGWFEAANGGTLFLDEIGDLPMSMQVKLLRVLQERQVVRLGSRRPLPIDVRFVAATNVELEQAVDAQRFRADLYYRLSVASVSLPPLRRRPGDILPLARHFMSVYAGKLGVNGPRLSHAAETALLAYDWPGNIRELENAVHFALIVCRDGVVDASDFRFSAASGAAPVQVAANLPAPRAVPQAGLTTLQVDLDCSEPAEPFTVLERALDDFLERSPRKPFHTVAALLVRIAFAHSGGNQVQTARLLGITRNTMRTLLKRHGMLDDTASADADVPADASDGTDDLLDSDLATLGH